MKPALPEPEGAVAYAARPYEPEWVSSNDAYTEAQRLEYARVYHKAMLDEPVGWVFEFPDKRVAPKFDSCPHGGSWRPVYAPKEEA